MSNRKIKIVADSSSDVLELQDVAYESAPLKIITSQREFVDDADLDVHEMVDFLHSYSDKSSTSCPNADDWVSAFGDAEEVFCVTITGSLSGSHNAAVLAKNTYEEQHPGRRVFVIDSLSTGPEIRLILEKLRELVLEEKSFDDICSKITKYTKRTGLLFMLESMRNLANNGRVSPIVAKVAGILGIRIVGMASDRGELEILNKCRGEARALDAVIQHMKSFGVTNGKVRIAHCMNINAANKLKELIHEEFTKAQIELYECRGLDSFYAENGGLLIGFERG